MDFDPITLAKGKTIRAIELTLLDVQKHRVVRHEKLEPQARTANFQLHYLEKQPEHNNRYPKDYDDPLVDGIVYVPCAQFEVTVTLEGGTSHKARSGVFEVDRRPNKKERENPNCPR